MTGSDAGTSNSPEGTAATGNSIVLSYQRNATGTDNDTNASDFTPVATPTPQNMASDGSSTPLAVTGPGAKSGVVGEAIAPFTMAATGGSGTITNWAATGLPAGVGINATSGQVSGTPSAACTCSVTVTATDSASATDQHDLHASP